MIEFHTANFCLALCSFGPPSRALLDYHLERCGITLHDAVGINCKEIETTDINAQVPSI